MKKNIGLGLSGFFTFIFISTLAQTYPEEALFFNRINPGGSARIQAMGGAQVALGGDYSTAYSNPAGLGFYNRSEATFSLGTNFYNSTSNYVGTSTSDSKGNFNVPGFSLVLHSDKDNGKLLSGNFAISFTRINNFNQNLTYQSNNSPNSLINYFIGESSSPPGDSYDQGYYPSQFQQGGYLYYTLPMLGYDNYLFGPSSETTVGGDSSKYHSYILSNPPTDPPSISPSLLKERIQTSGAQNQWNVAYSVNINDKFYLGASIGIPTINYTSTKTYSENFTGGSFTGFQLNENLHVTGTGINATLGTIIRPQDFIQFGLSVSTPTYYPTLSENYSANLSSNWNGYNYVDVTRPQYNTTLYNKSDSIYYDSPFLYSLNTPWRIRAGATFFIQKHGLITAEIEKVNYSNSSFGSNSSTPYDFSGDNSEIKVLFRNIFNIRLGGEYRYNNFRFRLGYSYAPDPYSSTRNNVNNSRTNFSGGVGYRTGKYFVDLGLIQSLWNSSYIPYSRGGVRYSDDNFSQVVSIKNSNFSAMVTFGFNL